jgi:predicted small lipoprotein YifL
MSSHTALRRPALIAAAAFTLALVVSGCGLKGALTMPSQSEEIVIRPAGGTGTEVTTPATPAGDTAAPPATPPAEKKITPKDERLPPPPLPGGNPGTVRSG